jgi:hypothetical protein
MLGRTLCGLSKQQLGARLGGDSTEVGTYEQGEKRISCKLLLETAKQLKARPKLFLSIGQRQSELRTLALYVLSAI